MTIKNPICELCGEGQLIAQVAQNNVSYKQHEKPVDCHYSVCSVCGSEQSDSVQLRKNKRAMTAFKKSVDGFLTGSEIKELRDLLGLTQSAAAKIFGGGPVAFSKYEADDVTQSDSMEKLLRVAKSRPDILLELKKLAGFE